MPYCFGRLRPAGLPGTSPAWCAAAPGTMIATTRARAIGTGTTRRIGIPISVFGWCGRPTSFPPFNGTAGLFARLLRAHSPAVSVSGTGGASGIGGRLRFAARGERLKDGAGESRPHGQCLVHVRRTYAQSRRLLGTTLKTPHLAFIHPPSKRPSSATMMLTC